MIKRRRGARKSRRPETICDSLNEAALNRIIQAACKAPDDLKREELRSALENVPSRYATHQSLRVSAKRKRAELRRILSASKRLKSLLSGDAWLLILNRLSVSDPDPRGELSLLNKILTALLEKKSAQIDNNDNRYSGLVWLIETTSDLLQEPPDRLLALVADFKTESSLEHIAGTHLPAIFERHLHGSRGRSRKPDGTPTGPCVRFVHQAMAELGMPYDEESIVRAMSRAMPGGTTRKKYIGRKQENYRPSPNNQFRPAAGKSAESPRALRGFPNNERDNDARTKVKTTTSAQSGSGVCQKQIWPPLLFILVSKTCKPRGRASIPQGLALPSLR
jgi:hypothetical protein